jgi:putative FmdB family regulatory protein
MSMATYEFECRECGKRFDVTAAISQHDRLKENPPACPDCGNQETRQLASMFSCKTPSGY